MLKKLLTGGNSSYKQFSSLAGLSSDVGPDRILPATDHRTWLPDGTVKLQLKDCGSSSIPPISVPSMFKQTVEKLPNHTALGTKGPGGENLRWSYTEYHEDVSTVAKAFISLGLERFHSVGILGYNSPEWVISNLASVHAGGFATGIYQTNSAEACRYVADNARANIIVVEDDIQLNKILQVKKHLPQLRAIVQYRGRPGAPGVISWDDLMEIGRGASDSLVEDRLRQMAVNQACILVYTSGTTGNPKGCMLSHDSITFNSIVTTSLFDWRFGEETIVSYLPLSHLAGQMLDIYWAIGKGCTVYFADDNALKGTLVENLKEYRPTRFLGVPRVWEKIEEKMRLAGKDTKGIKKLVADWAKEKGRRHHELEMRGIQDNSLAFRIAKKLVFSKVHEALGLENVVNVEGLATGSAKTPESTLAYFRSVNMNLLDLYGSTETVGTPCTANLPGPGNYRSNTVGKDAPEIMENKLINCDETGAGEIVSRGRAICMGYINNEEKTLEAIDDEGWLHSGDLCRKDKDGFYTVVGRIKEIIITSGGENIAPVNIEDEIKVALPDIISNVMVVGEQRKFLSCLLTLKVVVDMETGLPTDSLEQQAIDWIENNGGGQVTTLQQLITSQNFPSIQKAIQSGIDEANTKAISNAAKIQKWTVIPKDFSVVGGELSPSLKLKRFHMIELYKNEIDSMYR